MKKPCTNCARSSGKGNKTMSRHNASLNDEEINLIRMLVAAYRNAYSFTDISNNAHTLEARVKRLDRKMDKLLEHPDTEFV